MKNIARVRIEVGIDFVSLDRIRELWIRHRDRLAGDMFCDEELRPLREPGDENADYPANLSSRQLRYLGTRFAAKEAAYKALSPQGSVAYNWCEIRVIGARTIDIELDGNLGRVAREAGISGFAGSTSSTESSAIAMVVSKYE